MSQSHAPRGHHDHPGRVRIWLVSLLTASAVMSSALALTGLITPGRWLPWALLGCGALAVLTSTLRMRAGASWGPSLAATIVAGYALVATFGGVDGTIDPLPDLESFARLAEVLRSGQETINASRAPVEAVPGIELLALGGIAAAYLLVDILVASLRSPAWSGLVLLSLWAPTILLEVSPPPYAFWLAAAAFLALLLASSAPRLDHAHERRTHLARSGGALVVTLVAVVALVPVISVLPAWDSRPMPYLGPGGDGAIQLSESLDMRSDLGRRSDQVILRYTADPIDVGPLRLRTLDVFDGQSWTPSDPAAFAVPLASGDVLWPESIPELRDPPRRADDEGTGVDPDRAPLPAQAPTSRLEVEVVDFRDPRVPLSIEPRTLTIDGAWSYNALRDEVVGDRPLSSGDTYELAVTRLFLTADKLRDASSSLGPLNQAAMQYRAVPRTSGTEEISALALEITADATTDYDRAIALQTFFRSPQFTYSGEVPLPRSDDAVLDFLTDRTGYCVQFATAMTVMARSLGLPTRMAVGFLSGERVDPGEPTFQITGKEAHAWPEIWFDGYGWVRFEPTPPVQTGALPGYADPNAPSDGLLPAPGTAPSFEAPVPADNEPSANPSAAPQSSDARGAATSWWLAGLGTLVLGGAVVALVITARRRQRHHHVPRKVTPERAWTLLGEDARAAGLPWSEAWTPAQAHAHLREKLRVDAQDEHGEALDLLARAVQEERYAPRGTSIEAHELHDAVETVRAQLARFAAAQEAAPQAVRV